MLKIGYNTVVFKKSITFLNLLKTFKSTDIISSHVNVDDATESNITFTAFIKMYTTVCSTCYIFEQKNNLIPATFNNSLEYRFFKYYTKTNHIYKSSHIHNLPLKSFSTFTINNCVVFSKPKKQLFMLFYKNKPVFVFTGGLMRIVMNEKRKSSKRLYKVAASIIKLATILLLKKNYFTTCYLRLINVGSLRSKILTTFIKNNVVSKINYIFIISKNTRSAQKFSTRRSVKKYIKKRFKLQ